MRQGPDDSVKHPSQRHYPSKQRRVPIGVVRHAEGSGPNEMNVQFFDACDYRVRIPLGRSGVQFWSSMLGPDDSVKHPSQRDHPRTVPSISGVVRYAESAGESKLNFFGGDDFLGQKMRFATTRCAFR